MDEEIIERIRQSLDLDPVKVYSDSNLVTLFDGVPINPENQPNFDPNYRPSWLEIHLDGVPVCASYNGIIVLDRLPNNVIQD
jgi:hypothetical protein